MPQPPPVLDYHHAPVGAPVSLVRFAPLSTLLLLANVLVGFVMAMGIIFLDRLGAAGWIMTIAGLLLIYVVVGCLSVDRPSFRRALVFAAPSWLLCATAFCLLYAAEARLSTGIVRNKFTRLESNLATALDALELARNICAIAAVASCGLIAYVVFCLYRARKSRPARSQYP